MNTINFSSVIFEVFSLFSLEIVKNGHFAVPTFALFNKRREKINEILKKKEDTTGKRNGKLVNLNSLDTLWHTWSMRERVIL